MVYPETAQMIVQPACDAAGRRGSRMPRPGGCGDRARHDRARRTGACAAAGFICIAACAAGCDRARAPANPAPLTTDQSHITARAGAAQIEPAGPIRFENRASQAGLESFVHHSGKSLMYYQPETHGGGVAFTDLNGDGQLDLVFATFNMLRPDPDTAAHQNRAFRGRSDGTFEDVSAAAELGHAGWTHGIAVDDFDNDGLPDLLLTGYTEALLFQNQGDGTFRPCPAHMFPPTTAWATSAAWLDSDGDGDLDVYVCCYANWTPETHPYCGDGAAGVRVYCRPSYLQPTVHLYFRNEGDGRFREMAQEAGMVRGDGRGLGVIAVDVNGDAGMDLYIANDMTDNFLYLNDGHGRFRDESLASGTALSGYGAALAGMGVDAEDLDGDRLPELFCTNLTGEPNSVYLNLGRARFRDVSLTNRLGADSLPDTGWGTALADFDNDTRPDVVVSNGHVDDYSRLGIEEPYRQRARLWHNLGTWRFASLGGSAGDYFATAHSGRGLAVGDVNGDGRLDIALNHLDESPALLLNRTGGARRSIVLNLVGTRGPRSGTGATVDLVLDPANPVELRRQLKGGGSYLSTHARQLVVGVGSADSVAKLRVRWPSQIVDEWTDLRVGAVWSLREGAERARFQQELGAR